MTRLQMLMLSFLLIVPAMAQQPPEVDDLLTRSEYGPEQRLQDLSTIWSEAKFSFAYYNTIAENWDDLYRTFIPRVLSATSDYAFYLELMRFGANLHDGHSGVFFPRTIANALGYPPLEIRKIEGRAVIFRFLRESEELSRLGVRPGLAIVEVDGKPVEEQIAFWRDLMCASTSQARDRLTYFRILTGPRNSMVDVTFEEPEGKRRTVSLTRSEQYFGDTNLTPPEASSSRQPVGGIGYFRADIMRSPVDEAFAEYLETSGALKGLVLDLRYNGGGSDLISFNLISRLIDEPIDGPVYEVTSYRADRRATRNEQDVHRTSHSTIEPAAGKRFNGWLVVLIGEQSHSATEGGFLSVVQNRPRTILMGEPTAGSTGQPLVFRLSTGGVAAVCSRRSLAPDGSPFVGVGFQPDIPVRLTRKDLSDGTDSVIDRAFDVLQDTISSED